MTYKINFLSNFLRLFRWSLSSNWSKSIRICTRTCIQTMWPMYSNKSWFVWYQCVTWMDHVLWWSSAAVSLFFISTFNGEWWLLVNNLPCVSRLILTYFNLFSSTIEKWKPAKCSLNDLFRAVQVTIAASMLEPTTQICGGSVILDFDGLSLTHIMQFTPAFAALVLTWIQVMNFVSSWLAQYTFTFTFICPHTQYTHSLCSFSVSWLSCFFFSITSSVWFVSSSFLRVAFVYFELVYPFSHVTRH